MNLYYAIIGDALHSVRKTDNKYRWKDLVFSFFSAFLLFNILTVFSVIDLFTGFNIVIEFEQCLPPALPMKFSFIAFFGILSMCIIYFSIFYKAKYRYIYRNYKHRKGKLLIAYFVVSGLLFSGFLLLKTI